MNCWCRRCWCCYRIAILHWRRKLQPRARPYGASWPTRKSLRPCRPGRRSIMCNWRNNAILVGAMTLGYAAQLPAAEAPSLAKDLTAVISLLGLPCGQVVSVVHKGDNDNVATCNDGNRYHVFLNADGRVVAQKQ